MIDEKIKPVLQVQPSFASRNEWEAIAVREGLHFEVIEYSVPPVLTEDEPEGDAGTGRSAKQTKTGGPRRDWYRTNGFVSAVHGAFIDVNPASGDEGIRQYSRRRCAESCSLAVDLGAGHVVFHSSCASFLRGTYLDEWAARCASFYEELAARFDLNIWIENSQDMDAGPIRKLMERISVPKIGVCLDLGHVNYSRMPMEEWFESVGEWVGYLHLSDNMGLFDDHLPLGRGTVDWEKADALWRLAGRKMPLTLEVGGVRDVEMSVAYLKEHGYFGQS